MDLRKILVVYGILDLHNSAGNCPTQLFIDSQGFTGINYFSIISIKYVPHMINYHNLVPNQEARLSAIQQCKLKVLVCWSKYSQISELAIITATWTTADLTNSITQINIESPLGGDIKVAHPGKFETGHKWTTWDVKW